jgi:hypothetical protein
VIVVTGVAAEPFRGGSFFLGPQHKFAWSPVGELSSALGYVVAWDVAMHPWDPWPLERRLVFPPPPKRKRRPAAPVQPRRGSHAR